MEEAKAAPLPQGYVTAYISTEAGYHVYWQRIGWKFHSKE